MYRNGKVDSILGLNTAKNNDYIKFSLKAIFGIMGNFGSVEP